MIAKIKLSKRSEFYITGISVRTSNQNGQAQKDIGELWRKFMQEDLLSQIPNKVADDIYCVYTDYETDHNGSYTAILGCNVNSLPGMPDRFTDVIIPEGNYQVYTLQGKFPDNVSEAWQDIWNSGTKRKYTADFDVYYANAESFEQTEVKIYLAVV